MSADVLSRANATVSISRPTPSQGASGQPTLPRTIVYTDILCSMQQSETGQGVVYGADRNVYRGQAYFTTTTDIREGDYIVWGARTFMVLGVDIQYDHNGLQSHYKVEWEEVKG